MNSFSHPAPAPDCTFTGRLCSGPLSTQRDWGVRRQRMRSVWPSSGSFFAETEFYCIMHASERNHGTTRPGIVLFVACLLGLLGAARVGARPAYGQENEQAQPSQPRWATGVQIFPVPGVSVRRAISTRLSVQIAGIPGFGDRNSWFAGGVGGRLLYRFKFAGANSLYASGAYSLFFISPREGVTFPAARNSQRVLPQRRSHFWIATFGAEMALGAGISLSLEWGGAWLRGHGFHGDPQREDIGGRFTLLGGIGLHYRWGSL